MILYHCSHKQYWRYWVLAAVGALQVLCLMEFSDIYDTYQSIKNWITYTDIGANRPVILYEIQLIMGSYFIVSSLVHKGL